jgi:hypothetical protein
MPQMNADKLRSNMKKETESSMMPEEDQREEVGLVTVAKKQAAPK